VDGAGELTITSNRGSTCKGTFVYVNSREGSGTFNCSDGRSGPFKFVSTGRRGTGQGTLDGQPFTFTFGWAPTPPRSAGPAIRAPTSPRANTAARTL